MDGFYIGWHLRVIEDEKMSRQRLFVCCLSSKCKDEKDEKEGKKERKKERGDRKKKEQNVSQRAAHRDTANSQWFEKSGIFLLINHSSSSRPLLALNNSKNMLTYKKIEHIKWKCIFEKTNLRTLHWKKLANRAKTELAPKRGYSRFYSLKRIKNVLYLSISLHYGDCCPRGRETG